MIKAKKKLFRKIDVFEAIMLLIVLAYSLSIIAVLYLGLLNSVKTYDDSVYSGNFFGFPKEGWQFQYYTTELFSLFRVQPVGQSGYVYLPQMMWNSFLYAVLMSFFCIGTQVMVAYACAKYTFKLNKVLYTIAIVTMIIPIVGSLASEMQIAEALGLRNSMLGVCLIKCKYSGLYFLVFYASFKGISWTYAEAAQIDGASNIRIFLQIMLPLVINTIFAVFILQFINNWNDYYTPMLFVPQMPTIAYGLFEFKNYPEREAATPLKLAASMASCVPVVIVFIIFRNKIMGNVAIGGIKG